MTTLLETGARCQRMACCGCRDCSGRFCTPSPTPSATPTSTACSCCGQRAEHPYCLDRPRPALPALSRLRKDRRPDADGGPGPRRPMEGVTGIVARPSRPLANRRVVAGYTQDGLAEALGVDRTTIGRWERGAQLPQPWQTPRPHPQAGHHVGAVGRPAQATTASPRRRCANVATCLMDSSGWSRRTDAWYATRISARCLLVRTVGRA